MTCAKLETLWIPYLDGKLNAQDRAIVESHLAECAECATLRDDMLMVSQALDTWEAPPPSPWFDAQLRQKIAADSAPRTVGYWWGSVARAFPLGVAALMLLAAVLIWTGNHKRPVAAVTPVPEAKMEEVLHAADEVDLLNNFELLSELKKPAEVPHRR